MNNTEIIKRKIERLFQSDKKIHIRVKNTRPKNTTTDLEVVIKGVYPNIFCVIEADSAFPKFYSFQYTDVLIGRIEILELSQ